MSAAERWIGKEIGEYRITEHISDGGMASVYRAEHKLLGNLAAVKILNPVLSTDPEIRERFLQEARIQIALQHTNIVRVLNAYSTEEYSALVLELVEGQSLDKVLKRRGKLPVDEALTIFKQVLDAVGHAHEKGVIHRDLKPSNIMVCADGSAKVTDFGIAKVLGDTKLTRTGTSMGSPDYMSPEQVLGKKDIDHRTDIYSLGATLYEMLTGRPPFVIENGGTSDSDFSIKKAHVENSPDDPRTLVRELAEPIVNSILHSLAKDKNERFSDCGEFSLALLSNKTDQAKKRITPPNSYNPERVCNRRMVLVAIALAIISVIWILLDRKIAIRAMLILQPKCSLGNSSSCAQLADIYASKENGFLIDPVKARFFAEKACRGEVTVNCLPLAELLMDGLIPAENDVVKADQIYETICRRNLDVDDTRFHRSCFMAGSKYYLESLEIEESMVKTKKKPWEYPWDKLGKLSDDARILYSLGCNAGSADCCFYQAHNTNNEQEQTQMKIRACELNVNYCGKK